MLKNKAIIFDLGGVLLDEPERNLTKGLPFASLGIPDSAGNVRIFNRLFEFAQLFYGDVDCKKMWLMGTLSSNKIVQKVKEYIDLPEHYSFFKDSNERNLIKYGAEHILISVQLAELTELNPQGIAFVQRCKQQGIRCLVLSNWDPESFELIKHKFPKLFSLFDEKDIFIPANLGFMKPEAQAFEKVINKAGLDKSTTLFIDDSPMNVVGAQMCNIHAVYHREWGETEKMVKQIGLEL